MLVVQVAILTMVVAVAVLVKLVIQMEEVTVVMELNFFHLLDVVETVVDLQHCYCHDAEDDVRRVLFGIVDCLGHPWVVKCC